jgi:hypothetical protein
MCLSRYDEALGSLVAIAVTESFPPGATMSFSPAFAIDWAFEEEFTYHVQLCDSVDGNKRVLSDCRFSMSEAVAARRLRRPLMRQLVPTPPLATAPTATLLLSLQSDSASRTRVFRMHASCEDLRGATPVLATTPFFVY